VQFAPLDVLSFTLLRNYTSDNMLRNVCQLIQHTAYLITVCISMCFLGDRFALHYRTIVCHVLSVTLVYCGQTVGQIKMKLGMQVGLGPGHSVR